jgi:putative FmdB family regulatory protein
MPYYDYRCLDCKRRFDLFLRYNDYGNQPIVCPHCKSEHVQRRIGRVRIARSDASRMESMADPGALDQIDEDPRALGKMMRQMSSEMGEEMGPEFNEVVHRLEKGQTPDQIEKELPDLGGGDDGGGFGGGGLDAGGDLDF